jgi:hypothetical protein
MEPGTARSARRADRAGGSPGRAGRRRPPRLPRSTCHKSRPGNSRHVTQATGAAVPTRADRNHLLPGPTPTAGRCRAVLPRLYMLGDLAGAGGEDLADHRRFPHPACSRSCSPPGAVERTIAGGLTAGMRYPRRVRPGYSQPVAPAQLTHLDPAHVAVGIAAKHPGACGRWAGAL